MYPFNVHVCVPTRNIYSYSYPIPIPRTQQKTAEYDATIADLEIRRAEIGGVMPIDRPAIEAITARLAEVRE